MDLYLLLPFGVILFGLIFAPIYFLHKCYAKMHLGSKVHTENGTLPTSLGRKSQENRTCALTHPPPRPARFFPRGYRHELFAKELGLQKTKQRMLVKMHILSHIKPIDNTQLSNETEDRHVPMSQSANAETGNHSPSVDSQVDVNVDTSSSFESKETEDNLSFVHNNNNSNVIPDSQESLISTRANYNSSDFDNSASVMSLSTPVITAQPILDTSQGTSASSMIDLFTDISNVNELDQVHICQTHHFICSDCGIDYINNDMEAQSNMSKDTIGTRGYCFNDETA